MITDHPEYRYDYHVHTHYSACGKEDAVPVAILQRARECGLLALGFSDHFHQPGDLEVVRRLERDLRAAGYGPQRAHSSPDSLRYYLGVEAEMNSPDDFALPRDEARELDFVMAAVNHYHLEQVQNPKECTPQAFALHSLAMLDGAIATGYVDTIAHPFTPLGQGPFSHEDIFRLVPEGALLDCLDRAARAGVAMELNPSTFQAHYSMLSVFYRMCLDRGVRISLGSDSHSLATLGYPADRCPPAALLRGLGIGEPQLWHPKPTHSARLCCP